MKTSLVLEDSLFREAQKEAHRARKTLSEVISEWARLGKDLVRGKKRAKPLKVRALDLGGPATIDINSRREWMDLIDSKDS